MKGPLGRRHRATATRPQPRIPGCLCKECQNSSYHWIIPGYYLWVKGSANRAGGGVINFSASKLGGGKISDKHLWLVNGSAVRAQTNGLMGTDGRCQIYYLPASLKLQSRWKLNPLLFLICIFFSIFKSLTDQRSKKSWGNQYVTAVGTIFMS